MNQTGFLSFYLRMFIKPTSTYRLLENYNNRMLFGFLALLVPAIGYTLFYIMASRAGGAPTAFVPWLNLPMEKYFYYGIFLSLPGYILAFFFAVGFMYFISSLMRIKITFESLVMIIGFGISVGSWIGMIHDLTDAFLGFIGVIDISWYEGELNKPTFWRYLLLTLYSLYFIWFFVLFYKGIRTTTNTTRSKATIFSLLSIISFQSVLLIFIR